jgi:hypothetical protein
MDQLQPPRKKKSRSWKDIFLFHFLLGFGGPVALTFTMVYLIDNKIIATDGNDKFMVNFMVTLIIGCVVSFCHVLYLIIKKLTDLDYE